jgi:hypothetical protein
MNWTLGRKILTSIALVAIIAQSFSPYIAVLPQKAYAQDATPTVDQTAPTPSQVTSTVTETPSSDQTIISTPTDTITPTPTDTPTPGITSELTPTPTVDNTATVTPTPTDNLSPPSDNSNSQPQVLGDSISVTPTLNATPSATPTPTETSTGDEQISMTILKDVSAPSIDLNTVLEGSATLATDKADYAPTDTALITGSNLLPDTAYTLTISSNDKPSTSTTVNVTSDDKGIFAYAYQLDGNYRPNYKAELKDSDGIVVATTSFTDGPTPTPTTINVSELLPDWSTGVWASYQGPTSYDYVSPGSTAMYDGKTAAPIYAGVNIDSTDNQYEDQGLFAFKPGDVPISTFASQPLTYNFINQYGTAPVWVYIELNKGGDGDVMYQYVPTSNPTGWHTEDAATGKHWQAWTDLKKGIPAGPMLSLSDIAAADSSKTVSRVYLTEGMGDAYHSTPNGTVAWVDTVTIGSTTYDFVLAPTVPNCNANSSFDSFNLGSVNDQGGWSSTGQYDQAIVSNSYGFSSFGCKSLRLSNAITSGSFGDQTFSPAVANPAGESTSYNHFEASFDIGSTQSIVQPGLFLSASPDDGNGSRMSYVGFQDENDGIHVIFYDVTDPGPKTTTASFNESDVATIDRNQAHSIKFSIDFVPGPANDVVKLYVDNVLKATGTTWEDYYRYDSEQTGSGNTVPTTSKLLFREGGTAVPATNGQGYLIDNVSLSSTNLSYNPTTNPAANIAMTDATLNGTNGPIGATGHSFWVSLAPFSTASPTIPSGVYSSPDFGVIPTNTPFSVSLSSITANGVPAHLPAVTPNTKYYFVAWSLVGGTWYPGAVLSFTTTEPAPTTVKVTIDKYINGVQATAANTNNASFPMHAIYPGGEGPYALNTTGFNNIDPYKATTSDMPLGSNYSTYETPASSCTTDYPFSLVGYSTGTTLANAVAATVTTTVPNFTNLTSDKFIIVWNKTCPPVPVHLSPANNSSLTTATWLSADWSDVTDPSSPVSYIYESSNSQATNPDGSFVTSAYVSGSLSTSEIPTTGTPEGIYYWHVRSQDASGNKSAWSTPWKVTVDNTAPAVNLVFPTPGPSATSFQAVFSEDVNKAEAENPANYFLNNWPGFGGSGNLVGHATISYNATSNIATVTFTDPANWYISPEQQWGVQNIHDLAGNLQSVNPFTAYSTPMVPPTTPSANPVADNYNSNQSVTLTSSDSGSGLKNIYYTTDGTTPDNTKTLYIGAITVDHDMTIKAIAYDNAGNASGVSSAAYGIPPVISDETFTRTSDTSLVTSWTTNYPATSRVVYDTVSHATPGSAPNYGYAYSTAPFDTSPEVTSHSVLITGLSTNTDYYFRTISGGSPEALGTEQEYTIHYIFGLPGDGRSDGGSTGNGGGGASAGSAVLGAATTLAYAGGAGAGTGGQVLGASAQTTPEVLGAATSSATPTPVISPNVAGKTLVASSTNWLLNHIILVFVILIILALIAYFIYRKKRNKIVK